MSINRIPCFLSATLIVVLEDALQRLDVIRHTHDRLLRKSLQSPSLNNSVVEVSPLLPLSSLHREESFFCKMTNIEFQRLFIDQSLNMLRTDLERNGEFVHFIQMVKLELEKEEIYLYQNSLKEKFNIQVNKGQEAIDAFRKETGKQEKALGLGLQNLKHQKQEIIQKKVMQLNLIKVEMKQSIEQVESDCKNEIKSINESIKKCLQGNVREKDAHKSYIEDSRIIFTNIICDEDQFIKNYNLKKNEITSLITYYIKQSKGLSDKLQGLSNKYKLYLQTVEEDKIWKLELKIEEDKLNACIDKAKIIENWWRWIIVRDNLLAKMKKKSKKNK